jgi:hypothetical protein
VAKNDVTGTVTATAVIASILVFFVGFLHRGTDVSDMK